MASQTRNNAAFRWSVLPFLVLVLTSMLFAHGDMKHVKGTVKAVSADSITVETETHEIQVVQVTSQTKFLNGSTPSSLGDLKVGSRVVIHAKPSGGKLEAAEVKFGATDAGADKK